MVIFEIKSSHGAEVGTALNLVRPISGHEYSFCSMTEDELLTAYADKTEISSSDIQKFCRLWKLYQRGNCEEMIRVAKELNQTYSFIMPACEAHADRCSFGRPEQSIIRIIEELQTDDFIPVFQEFCKRESIYGFGDVQVKRLYKKIVNHT